MAQIKSEAQYKAIMGRIDELFFSTDENTPADDPKLLELDALSALVEEYEQEHFPIATPTLAATLQDRMSRDHLSQKDLSSILGISTPRLSEIMTGKKTPTYNQARTMVLKLDIDPAIVLAV